MRLELRPAHDERARGLRPILRARGPYRLVFAVPRPLASGTALVAA